MEPELIQRLSQPADSKVVLCVLDGLGGLPGPRGRTELEEAATRHLDRAAERGVLGQTLPVGYGITPGSGPGHLGLFGYDPLRFEVGRGVLEATGIDMEVGPGDLCARGNLCTVDGDGRITDRRAGRVATEITAEIAEAIQQGVRVDGVEVIVRAVREHRFVLMLRGADLSSDLSETDPQRTGVPPLPTEATSDDPHVRRTAELVQEVVRQAQALIGGREQANALTLRGWSQRPNLPQFPDLWRLRAAACTVYPMYRGLARLVGMQSIDGGDSLSTQIAALRDRWDDFDFFFLHFKYTDSAGEDGDFQRKRNAVQEFDAHLPEILALAPNVLVVTGDHSTPATMAAHSWHPVPTLLWGDHVRVDRSVQFNEHEAAAGGMGTFPAKELLPIAFAHAGRLAKFGA